MAEKDQNKLKALEAAIAHIEKEYGKGSVMKLGDTAATMNVESIPSGALSLDIALGVGGVPRGRIIEVVRRQLLCIWLQKLRSVEELQGSLMQSMHWIRYMQKISV